MHFESPVWFSLLVLIPLLWLLAWVARRRAEGRLRLLAAPELLPTLFGSARWPGVLRLALFSAGIVLAAAALARPSLGYRLREIQSAGSATILAIDVSDSMLCTDETPDRLTRAKLAARDILAAAKGRRMGVVLFAGEAFLQCPLTQDAGALATAIDAAAPSAVPRKGTDIAKAIAEARAAFGSGDGAKTLVLFTDGEDLEGAGLREARSSNGMKIVTVGVGTREGAPVPEPGGTGYRRDSSGRVVTSRPDFASLAAIAEASGGFSEALGAPFLADRIAALGGAGGSSRESTVRVSLVRYRWPLAAALLFFAAEAFVPAARRKAAPLAALLFLFLPLSPESAKAAAEVTPENPRAAYNEGVELYGKGDFAKAAEAFARAGEVPDLPDPLRAKIAGNAGAAKIAGALALLPKAGEASMDPKAAEQIASLLSGAKKDLETALNLNPGDALLKRNYDLAYAAQKELEKRKSPPPQKEQNPQQGQNNDNKQNGAKDQQQASGGENQGGRSGPPQGDSAKGNASQGRNSAPDSPSPGENRDASAGNDRQRNDAAAPRQGASGQNSPSPRERNQGDRSGADQTGQAGTPQSKESAAGKENEAGRPQEGESAANAQEARRGEESAARNAARQANPPAGTSAGESAGKREEAPSPSPAAGNDKTGAEEEKAALQKTPGKDGDEKTAEETALAKDAKDDTADSQPDGEKKALAAGENSRETAGDRAEERRETPAGEGEVPRTEGEHTASLERPADPVTPGTDAAPQAPQPAAADGAMTPEEARQLLKILGTPDKLLPAGKTKEKSDNFTGRDW